MDNAQRANPGPQITTAHHGTQLPLLQPCQSCIATAQQFEQIVPAPVAPNSLTVIQRSIVGTYSCSRCRRGWSVSYSMGPAI